MIRFPHPGQEPVWTGAVALAAAVLGGLGVGGLARTLPAPLLLNESPSLPRGVYVRQPEGRLVRGAVTATPQPRAARPYLASLGMLPEVLLIKRVAAVEGDRVCAAPGRLTAASRTVLVWRKDRRGVDLPAWSGCRQLKNGEVFLLGDTAGSFDSRYFGPVRADRTTGVYRELFSW